MTARFWQEGPFTSPTGCRWLVDRGAKAVGYDYPPDYCIRDTIATPRRKPDRAEYTTHAIQQRPFLHQKGTIRCSRCVR